MFLICILLMTDEVECLSICLLVILLLFSCEFKAFVHFQLVILLICKNFPIYSGYKAFIG